MSAGRRTRLGPTAEGRMCPQGAGQLVLTGTPGGPRGPTGPGGPCSPRSPGSPCGESRWGEHRAAGHLCPTASPGRRDHAGGTLLGTGDGPAALPQTEEHGTGHWSLVQGRWPQQEQNQNPPSPEVLTSRPGSPCFPGSPCRQEGGEGRDTPTLPHGPPMSIPSPEQRVSGGVAPPAPLPLHPATPTHSLWGQLRPPTLDHTHPQPGGARGPGFAFQPVAAIQPWWATVPL